MRLKISFIILFFVLCALFSVHANADTVTTKDGQETRGIVVEDYSDRLVISTVNGEVTIKKSDIKELYFDEEENNLINLAEQAKERHDFTRAFTYYDMALKKNPDSKVASDGLVFIEGYMFRKEESEKTDDIKRRENIERYGTAAVVEKSKTEEERLKDAAVKLKETTGLTLVIEGECPKVSDVSVKSPAYLAGIRKGDSIISIWGKLARYMPLIDIMDKLLDKPSLEIKCTIERVISADPEGASFSMEFEGLTVSGVKEGSMALDSGLKKDDLIVKIGEESTRYMPLKKAVSIIKKAGAGGIKLTIRREMLIWRGE